MSRTSPAGYERGPMPESIGMGPKLIQIYHIGKSIVCCFSSFKQNSLDKPNIVKVHRTRATGHWAALSAKADGDAIDIGKIHAE